MEAIVAVVEYNYVAQEPDELTLRKGDIIKEINMMHGGWWEGTLRDRRGMFPDNFVKVIEPSSIGGTASGAAAVTTTVPTPTAEPENSPTIKREEVQLRNGSGRRWCKVLFSYDPCNEDELALVPYESIEFLGEVEEGWWKGRLRGAIGVFPSNFVSPPASEEKELCKVLFPYEAANEDELTLVEGDIITLVSRDAPDRGWWKGELRGQFGLFPDNFVEILGSKNDQRPSDSEWQETNQGTSKSSSKHSSYTRQRGKKAHARKSVLGHADSSSKKPSLSSSTSSTVTTSTSQITSINSSTDKKSVINNHSLMTSLKRLVADGNVDANDSADTGLGEELDGVERGEGAPLSHLTASRAKAPRRRLPSTQLLRHQTSTVKESNNAVSENNIANGNADPVIEPMREDESDAPVGIARRKAPWIEELIHNQMEKRKSNPPDRVDKPEIKKERSFPRSVMSTSASEVSTTKSHLDSDDVWVKDKDKSPRSDTASHTCPVSPTITPSTPAYVPYRLYSQLLDRVATLEEKQIMLQRTVSKLSEQLVPLLANASTNSKV
ncbi:SH3 domain-containing kinase-binding protein 1 [Venturia canescens]|uniref:SH3 domain-containing kinase-binding protein 1 n=1 Tax=Venturia canescens TaxID=32260 RepID=UPI001C9BFC6D|nr:SH3 domain-containing kinase-binding protein 1-like [Venturia canescens]